MQGFPVQEFRIIDPWRIPKKRSVLRDLIKCAVITLYLTLAYEKQPECIFKTMRIFSKWFETLKPHGNL